MPYGNESNIPSALSSTPAGVSADSGEINTLDGVTAGTVSASKAVVVDGSKDIDGFNDMIVENDLTVENDAAVTGDISAATGTIADLTPSAYTAVARTASADGTGTGTIADSGSYQLVAVTSAGANNIIVLPTPTPGTVIDLIVGANGYELRSDTPASVEIGGGTGASAESAIPAESMAHLVCITATQWVGYTVTDATLAVVEAAA